MHTLLRRALQQLLQTHLAIPLDPARLTPSIAAKWRTDITYSKLSRLPLGELKNALKVPCPVDANRKEDTQIAAFKRLRQNMTVDEAAVCGRCTRNCPFRSLPFNDMPVKPETSNKAALHDLLSFLIAFSRSQDQEYSSLRWASAYKVVLALDPFLHGLAQLSKESFLFRELLKTLESEERRRLVGRKRKGQAEAEEARKALAGRKIVL